MIRRLHAVPPQHRDSLAVTASAGIVTIVFAVSGKGTWALAAGCLMWLAALSSVIRRRVA